MYRPHKAEYTDIRESRVLEPEIDNWTKKHYVQEMPGLLGPISVIYFATRRQK
jgi:hypothetical protein